MNEPEDAPAPIADPIASPGATNAISLSEERAVRLRPLTGIPAPNTPLRASAVPAYAAPLSFDWRVGKSGPR